MDLFSEGKRQDKNRISEWAFDSDKNNKNSDKQRKSILLNSSNDYSEIKQNYDTQLKNISINFGFPNTRNTYKYKNSFPLNEFPIFEQRNVFYYDNHFQLFKNKSVSKYGEKKDDKNKNKTQYSKTNRVFSPQHKIITSIKKKTYLDDTGPEKNNKTSKNEKDVYELEVINQVLVDEEDMKGNLKSLGEKSSPIAGRELDDEWGEIEQVIFDNEKNKKNNLLNSIYVEIEKENGDKQLKYVEITKEKEDKEKKEPCIKIRYTVEDKICLNKGSETGRDDVNSLYDKDTKDSYLKSINYKTNTNSTFNNNYSIGSIRRPELRKENVSEILLKDNKSSRNILSSGENENIYFSGSSSSTNKYQKYSNIKNNLNQKTEPTKKYFDIKKNEEKRHSIQRSPKNEEILIKIEKGFVDQKSPISTGIEQTKKFSPRFKVTEKDYNKKIPKTDDRKESFKKELTQETGSKGIRDRYLNKNREFFEDKNELNLRNVDNKKRQYETENYNAFSNLGHFSPKAPQINLFSKDIVKESSYFTKQKSIDKNKGKVIDNKNLTKYQKDEVSTERTKISQKYQKDEISTEKPKISQKYQKDEITTEKPKISQKSYYQYTEGEIRGKKNIKDDILDKKQKTKSYGFNEDFNIKKDNEEDLFRNRMKVKVVNKVREIKDNLSDANLGFYSKLANENKPINSTVIKKEEYRRFGTNRNKEDKGDEKKSITHLKTEFEVPKKHRFNTYVKKESGESFKKEEITKNIRKWGGKDDDDFEKMRQEDRLEREKKAKLEKERKEKLEREREENEKRKKEKEKKEKERLEKERQEKIEKERIQKMKINEEKEREKERKEKERLEKERREKERKEKEKLELERMEREKERQRLEKQKEREKAKKEKEERETKEKERIEKEKKEKERIEKEKRERLIQEKKEKERIERERKEKLEKERQEKIKQEKLERERQEKIKQEKLERERQERFERERLDNIERERKEKERQKQYDMFRDIKTKTEATEKQNKLFEKKNKREVRSLYDIHDTGEKEKDQDKGRGLTNIFSMKQININKNKENDDERGKNKYYRTKERFPSDVGQKEEIYETQKAPLNIGKNKIREIEITKEIKKRDNEIEEKRFRFSSPFGPDKKQQKEESIRKGEKKAKYPEKDIQIKSIKEQFKESENQMNSEINRYKKGVLDRNKYDKEKKDYANIYRKTEMEDKERLPTGTLFRKSFDYPENDIKKENKKQKRILELDEKELFNSKINKTEKKNEITKNIYKQPEKSRVELSQSKWSLDIKKPVETEGEKKRELMSMRFKSPNIQKEGNVMSRYKYNDNEIKKIEKDEEIKRIKSKTVEKGRKDNEREERESKERKERLEQERVEKEKDKERQRKEREKLEKERKEKIEREKEKERERQRKEAEKIEREREKERQRIEAEKLEREKAREKERQRIEKEKLEKEREKERRRIEAEKIEREKAREKERQRIEKEKLEKEREKERQRLEAEKLEKEKKRLEKEKIEREKIKKEKEERDRKEKERIEK